MKTDTREMGPLATRAMVQPDTLNAEARTVDLVWSAGSPVLRNGWDGPFYEELSMDPKSIRMGRLNNGAPLLADHDGSSVADTLGVVQSARLEGNQGIATVRFAPEGMDPKADMVFNKVRAGLIQNVSVGYRTYKMEETSERGAKVPTYRATDWEPYEISAVAMGADDQAGFRSAGLKNECAVTQRGAAPQTMEGSKMSDEVKAPAPVVERKEVDEVSVRAEAVKAERVRVLEISKLTAKHGMSEEFTRGLVDGNDDLSAAKAQILDAMASRSDEVKISNHVRVEVGESSVDKFKSGATASLAARLGSDMRTLVAAADKKLGTTTNYDAGEFRGMSMLDLFKEHQRIVGGKTLRGLDREELASRALTVREGGETSTSDFPVLYQNLMYKVLLGAYTLAPDTWRSFCGTTTVKDFRVSPRFRIGTFGALDSMSEHGEYRRKGIPDGAQFNVSVGTKGNTIAITRQALINDDMGAVAATAQRLGRAAGLSIENDVYANLALNSGLGPTIGSTVFFSSTNANLNSTGSALSVAGLDADRVLLASQKDISGNEYLALKPKVLLVPIGLGGQARVINGAQYDVDNVGSVQNKFMQPNKVAGLFQNVIDTPRLSGTRRYLFTDPNDCAAILVAFLEGGSEAPFMDQRQTWSVDGIEWKVRLDYAVNFFDPKGAVTNAGV